MSGKISIVGSKQRVVDAPGLSIDELAGNVASKDDRISIALVKAAKGTQEPFLTLHYDEWICILKGKILFEQGDGEENITAIGGQTVFIKEGTRFRPSFLEDSEYVPVCLPAFSPSRCIREDGDNEEGNKISANLKDLHGTRNNQSAEEDSKDLLYHMTSVKEWEAAKASNEAYYPKTFEADGHYTHATAVPSRLVETANHFYQGVEGDWICLQFRRSVLKKRFGIVVKDEEAMPVGSQDVSQDWKEKKWVCPHVYGGIPLQCVEKTYPMKRDGPKYLGIEGLTN